MESKESNIFIKLFEALPQMTDFKKGYLLGTAETLVEKKDTEKNQADDSERKRGEE